MKRPTLFLLFVPTASFSEVIDFEVMDIGAPPREWTLSMTNGDYVPRWEIASDPSSPAGDKVLAQFSKERSSARFPLAILPGAEIADGEIAVRFKLVSGRQAAGLVWRYRDENNYYVVTANALDANIVLYKIENGRRHILGRIGRRGPYDDLGLDYPVPARKWNVLRVSFAGSSFTVWFEGEKLFERDDSTFTQGRVGLATQADSVAYFDAFEVSRS